MGKRGCDGCGRGELREVTETLSVTLPRCGVVASVAAPARRCAGCGEVHVDRKVFVRVQLSVACELADRGMRTGDTLRQMRKALGLRAVDLARLLDVTAETISHWETGKARPTRATFAAVAAMADEAIDGRTSTRDRLSVEADGQSHPRTLAVKLRAPSRA